MAIMKRRKLKNGAYAFDIEIYMGTDTSGKQRKYYRTFRAPIGTSAKEAYRLASAEAISLEQRMSGGMRFHPGITFRELAAECLADREVSYSGTVKHNTLRSYRYLLRRINDYLGDKRVADITRQDVVNLLQHLSAQGLREDHITATSTADIGALVRNKGLSRAAFARTLPIAESTLANACHGKPVDIICAKKIADGLNVHFQDVFSVHRKNETLSAKTQLEYFRVLRMIFAVAVTERVIERNPMDGVRPPKQHKNQIRSLEPEDIHNVLAAVDAEPLRWKALVYLLIGTGARRGEICGLYWDDLDLEKNTLTIRRNLCYAEDRGLYEGTPKTGQERTIAIPQQCSDILKQWKEEQDMTARNLRDRWKVSPHVFTAREGGPMNPTTVTGWLRSFSRRHPELPGLFPHLMRHSACSLLIYKGIDLTTVASLLGHSSSRVTAEIYSHAIDKAKAEATTALTEAFFE